MLALYGGSAIAVFLVATWFLRQRLRASDAVVPPAWRWSGWLVWASLLLGGFTGVSALLGPALAGLPAALGAVVSGALFGLVVALVIWVGASLAFHADVDVWRWAVLFQVIALAGDVFASTTSAGAAYLVVALVPAAGLVALALAFRDPPQGAVPPASGARGR